MPRKAVFVLEKPLELAGGARLTFQLAQNHGGWNSDDNQNNNLGRFRFSVTDADERRGRPAAAGVREILAIPAEQRTPAQIDARLQLLAHDRCPNGRRRTTGSRRCGRASRRARRSWSLRERDDAAADASCSSAATSSSRPRRSTPGVPAFLHPLPTETRRRTG